MSTNGVAIALVLAAAALAVGFVLGRLTRQRGDAPAVAPPAGSGSGGMRPQSSERAPGGAGSSRAGPTAAARDGSAASASVLKAATSWGYQLQDLDVGKAAGSPFDLLVIDYAKDGDDDTALKPGEVERLKRRPDGGRRLVLAYLSIGEAESYRGYWRKEWKRQKPEWLLGENPEWEENYAVCFWDAGWQALLCGSPAALLDRIIGQGFDGVYLDKCDVTEDLREHEKAAARTRKDLEGDMVDLVGRLAAYARRKEPGFLVVMQNAETLLERPALRGIIDAVAKEELLFGLEDPEKPNSRDDISWARERLDLMRREGKPVFVVEYLNNRAKKAKAAEMAHDLGYVLYISDKDRELDRLHYEVLEA
jgi:cysteinyl-tRNA synthetase